MLREKIRFLMDIWISLLVNKLWKYWTDFDESWYKDTYIETGWVTQNLDFYLNHINKKWQRIIKTKPHLKWLSVSVNWIKWHCTQIILIQSYVLTQPTQYTIMYSVILLEIEPTKIAHTKSPVNTQSWKRCWKRAVKCWHDN